MVDAFSPSDPRQSDLIYTHFSDARTRQSCTMHALRTRKGNLQVTDAMAILRDHGRDTHAGWTPAKGLFGATVCSHAGFGPVRAASQTVGSLVPHPTPSRHTHWLTGAAAPCTGIFKPVWTDAGLPPIGPTPSRLF